MSAIPERAGIGSFRGSSQNRLRTRAAFLPKAIQKHPYTFAPHEFPGRRQVMSARRAISSPILRSTSLKAGHACRPQLSVAKAMTIPETNETLY
jgi:hypothetical protein